MPQNWFTVTQKGAAKLGVPQGSTVMLSKVTSNPTNPTNPTTPSTDTTVPAPITVTPGTPVDLTVGSVIMSPASPKAGDEVQFSIVVTNRGGTATGGTIVGVGFIVDGATVNWSDDNTNTLPGGYSRLQTANGGTSGKSTWTATSGNHTIGAYVDDVNRIDEGDETNNGAATRDVTIPSSTTNTGGGGTTTTPTPTPTDTTSNPQTTISIGSPGTVRTAYFGATNPGGGFNDSGAKRMSHSMNSAFILADGRSFLGTYWEEHAQELSGLNADGTPMDAFNNAHTYRGGYAVTSNATDVWMGQAGGIRRWNISGKGPVSFTNGSGEASSVLNTGGNDANDKVRGAAIIGSEIYVAANNGTCYVYSLSSFTQARTFGIGTPRHNGMVAVGSRLAVLTGTTLTWYSTTGAAQGTITGLTDPQGLALDDQNTGRVGVCQGAGDHRVLFFDYNSGSIDASAAVKSLGLQGGYMAGGTRGNMRDKSRFAFPRFARILSDGSYMVAMFTAYPQPVQEGGGAIIRRFNADGSLAWENAAMTFCDTGFIDSDGVGYTVRNKFLMDHGTNATVNGKGWSLAADTLDSTKSDDPRIPDAHAATAPIVRTVAGVKFMTSVGMYADAGTAFYRLDGETWIYGGRVGGGGWGQWTAKNGDYFQAKGDRVERRPFAGFDSSGFPTWGATRTWLTSGSGSNWSDLRRAQYDSDNDVLYVAGFTSARPQPNSNDMEKLAGSTLRRYNNWSTAGFGQQAWSIDLPNAIGSESVDLIRRIYMPIGMWVEGDYIFTGEMAYGLVRVYRKSNGSLVQTWNPAGVDPNAAQPSIDAAGNTLRFNLNRDRNMPGVGVLDIPNAVSATKLNDGRYAICVEDNGSPKIITYYWTPVS